MHLEEQIDSLIYIGIGELTMSNPESFIYPESYMIMLQEGV